ncbi:MAG: PAS domain S-box protein, partial [Thermoplasmata archaeon]|nr:PAS domain S-box protein [Thermoplasmata archaeon]
DGKLTFINRYLLGLGGYEEENVIGRDFSEFLPEDQLQVALKMFEDAVNGIESPAAEMDFLKSDGSRITVGYKGTIVYDNEDIKGVRAIVRDMTLQKQMEEALKDSEEQFRTLFESSTDAVMLLDKEGFFDCNEATLYIFGLEHKNEFVGIHPSQLSPPTQADGEDSLTAANKKIDDAYEWGHNKFEWTHRRKSGEDFPAEVWLTAFELKGKKVLQATVRDLTERKKIETELEKHREDLETMVEETWKDLVVSEEKYRNLVERANDGIIIISDGMIIFANQKTTEMLGYEMEDIIGKDFTVFLPDEIKEMMFDFYRRRMEGEEIPGIYEVMLQKKDGALIPVEINAGIITYSGEPADLAFIRDLTVRKKAEAELRVSEERFRQVAETTGEWIWEVDADGLYTYASPVVNRILGYEPEEIVGKKHFYDFFVSDKRDELKEMAFEVFSRKDSFRNFINENIHKDGQIVYLETSGSPILDNDDKLIGYRGADTDITERKRAEEAPLLTQFTIDRSSESAFWMDNNANFFYVNESACESLGYSRAELLNMTVHDIDPNFGPDIWPQHWEEIKEKNSFTLESIHKRKDGSTFPVEITMNYIRYKDKEYNCAIVRDITERIKSEKALIESERFLSNIFSSIQDGLIVMNTDLRIVSTNATIERWFSHKMPIIGKTCNDLLFCEGKDECLCPSHDVIELDEPASRIIPRIGPDGEEIGWLELHSFPLHDSETGDLAGVIEYIRDITK